MPVRVRLKCRSQVNQRFFIEMSADKLEHDGHAVVRVTTLQHDTRMTRQIERAGKLMNAGNQIIVEIFHARHRW